MNTPSPNGPSLFDQVKGPRPSWSADLLAAVLQVPGIGPIGTLELARSCPNPADYSRDRLEPIVTKRLAAFLPIDLPSPIEIPVDVGVIGFFDDSYPELLREIPDPPPVLWVRGEIPAGQGLAIVGTRSPSAFGRGAARSAARVAADRGLTVVSGLALGVDSIAHEETLGAGARTIAVLGSDVRDPLPKRNTRLADRILEMGGALIAEVPPGTNQTAHGLVRRNRLQSGMAVATFIAETGIPGGTLHTARFTIQQGRRLLVALPPETYKNAESTSGNRALLDPDGCAPELLGAGGLVAEQIRARRPVADAAVRSSHHLDRVLAELL